MISALPVTTNRTDSSILEEKRELVWNHPRSIESIIEELDLIQSKCEDFTAEPLNTSLFKVDDNRAFLEYQDITGVTHCSPLSVHSLTQLCTMAGVPGGYIKKCVETKGDWGKRLAEDNINSWLEHSDVSNTLMREYNGSLRGVLSSRYSCFDAPEIARVLRDNLNFDDFTVVGSMVNEERFHARIINKYGIETINDKDLCWGFFLDSSDVGRSSVSISLFIWKQACTNGLVIPLSKGFTFKQVHRGSECEFATGIKNTIVKARPIVDEMITIINRASGISVAEAVKDPDSYAREKLVKTIKSYTGLSDNGIDDIFYYLVNGIYPSSIWGVVNAMTEAAQKAGLERRISLEKAAGKLLMTA